MTNKKKNVRKLKLFKKIMISLAKTKKSVKKNQKIKVMSKKQVFKIKKSILNIKKYKKLMKNQINKKLVKIM